MSILLYFSIILFSKVCVTEGKPGSDIMNSFTQVKNQMASFFKIDDFKSFANGYTAKAKKMKTKLKESFDKFIGKVVYDLDLCKEKNFKNLPFRTAFEEPVVSQEKNMSTLQLVIFHGYKVETHFVQTRDGYMLEIYRIFPFTENIALPKKNVVLLHHGLMGSSDDWLLLGPDRALPYLLSNAGYDVWLTNARGNRYSKFHAGFNVISKEFWDFSFHEMGHYDLPAVIEYIKTNSESGMKINFVGHSMGGTALLVLLSTLPEYNQVIKSATLLAPLAFMYQIKGPFKLLAEFYVEHGRDSLNFLGPNEFMPIQKFPRQFIEKYCKSDENLCLNPLLFLSNGGKSLNNKLFLDNVLGHVPAGISTKTVKHYLQLIKSGQFSKYDYGTSDNWKKHGQKTSPSYRLGDITAPIVLFTSNEDWLCTTPNIQTLLLNLPNVVIYHTVKSDNFSHTDFVWGDKAPTLVFHQIIDIFETQN